MKKAIILHGMPSIESYYNPEKEAQSNKHWLPWIQRQLILKNILAQAIELPEPYGPVYEKWAETFEQFNIDENTTLIGHSCGAGFLVRWLSENKIKVDKVALIAPYLDPYKKIKSVFFDFEIDSELLKRTNKLAIFHSKDDGEEMQLSKDKLKKNLKNVEIFEFENMGHFRYGDMNTREFPELRDFLLKD